MFESQDSFIALVILAILLASAAKIFFAWHRESRCVPLTTCAQCAYGHNGIYREFCQYKYSDVGDLSFYIRKGNKCLKFKNAP